MKFNCKSIHRGGVCVLFCCTGSESAGKTWRSSRCDWDTNAPQVSAGSRSWAQLGWAFLNVTSWVENQQTGSLQVGRIGWGWVCQSSSEGGGRSGRGGLGLAAAPSLRGPTVPLVGLSLGPTAWACQNVLPWVSCGAFGKGIPRKGVGVLQLIRCRGLPQQPVARVRKHEGGAWVVSMCLCWRSLESALRRGAGVFLCCSVF